jgi:hypothetical protein
MRFYWREKKSYISLTDERKYNKRCKAIPLQAWTGPEGSRSLRSPDFKAFRT